MNAHDYDETLLKAVKARIPPGINPVWFIMDVLSIGKEAAYRRLRGDVNLTLKEAALLSRNLDISLNEVIKSDSGKIYHYSIFLMDFETPIPEDYKVLETHVAHIRQGAADPFSQLTITTNVFPQQLYFAYKSMAQFAVFKWLHQSGRRKPKAYGQIKVEEHMQQIFKDSLEAHRLIRSTHYIFDRQLCLSLVNDLRYFSAVGLLKDEDMEDIRSEAHKLLHYMERLAVDGKYDNGNEVLIYISDIHFNKSYCNLRAGHYYTSLIEVGVLNVLASNDLNCYHKMNGWIHARRRLSTLISCSGEPQRIAFFKELHRQLDDL